MLWDVLWTSLVQLNSSRMFLPQLCGVRNVRLARFPPVSRREGGWIGSVFGTFDYDVACFSHLRWDFIYQRPQHLLRRFAVDSGVSSLKSLTSRRRTKRGMHCSSVMAGDYRRAYLVG